MPAWHNDAFSHGTILPSQSVAIEITADINRPWSLESAAYDPKQTFTRQAAAGRGPSATLSAFLRKKRGKIGAGPSSRPKTVNPNFS